MHRLAYYARVLRVLATIDFKMKYAQSVMGYFWSLAKPLAYFGVLWLVFGRFFRVPTGSIRDFPLYLMLGLVLYLFFVDAIGMALPAVTSKGTLLRRLRFSPFVLPIAATATAFITFVINSSAVVLFMVLSRTTPNLRWLLIAPLTLELYVLVAGVALIMSALFVRFHDIAQLWELGAQLMIFLTPVMYPASIFPEWAQRIVFVNPLVQIMQDIRSIILAGPQVTTGSVYGAIGYLAPLGVVALTLATGLALFWRNAPRFAERV